MSEFSDLSIQEVNAPSFDDPEQTAIFGVDRSFVESNTAAGRRQILLNYWPLVAGKAPPVNNLGVHEGTHIPAFPGLMAAHAIFAGLERPLKSDDNGEEIYIYLTKPEYFYRLIPSMTCIAKLENSPDNTVFACYVRRKSPETGSNFSGMILSWEWVKASADDPKMPERHEERYGKLLWREDNA